MPERITKQLLKVLEALLVDPQREWYGLELMDATKLSSGTLYPILHRLVQDGWLARQGGQQSDKGGPGRRLYVLTGVGEQAAARVVEDRLRAKRHATRRPPRPGAQPA
ncbi:PadR family transcriptional regulator [Baekduia sp. Peel2402]|uniref:PadR family transcriptional regulator n=1 Tax=Baekduia sp. Peel2402 TaxID=3458296 RepID=UPI00403E5801